VSSIDAWISGTAPGAPLASATRAHITRRARSLARSANWSVPTVTTNCSWSTASATLRPASVSARNQATPPDTMVASSVAAEAPPRATGAPSTRIPRSWGWDAASPTAKVATSATASSTGRSRPPRSTRRPMGSQPRWARTEPGGIPRRSRSSQNARALPRPSSTLTSATGARSSRTSARIVSRRSTSSTPRVSSSMLMTPRVRSCRIAVLRAASSAASSPTTWVWRMSHPPVDPSARPDLRASPAPGHAPTTGASAAV
jgi:hypothetical protein